MTEELDRTPGTGSAVVTRSCSFVDLQVDGVLTPSNYTTDVVKIESTRNRGRNIRAYTLTADNCIKVEWDGCSNVHVSTVGRKHRALRPQKPFRLIRDGEVGGSGVLYLTPTRYTVTTRMILH